MFLKQIDLETALKLAAKGHEIQTMEPTVPNPEKWTDYSPGTLQNLLNGCLFFRREPALEKPMMEELPQEIESGNPLDSKDQSQDLPEASKKRHLVKSMGAGVARKQKPIDTGKLMALHNAGWSNVKIAAELGISDVTVGKYLKQMKERRDGTIDA